MIWAKWVLAPGQAPGTAQLSWPSDGIVPERASPSLRREEPHGQVGVLGLSTTSVVPGEPGKRRHSSQCEPLAAETLRHVTKPLWINGPGENQAEKHLEHLLFGWTHCSCNKTAPSHIRLT